MVDYRKNQDFQLLITDAFGTENSLYSATRFNVPGSSVGGKELPTRFKDITIAGESVDEDDLNITLMIDDDFINYFYFKDWLEETTVFYDNKKTPYKGYLHYERDISVSLFNNEGEKIIEFIYEKCHIQSITGFELDSTLNDDTENETFDIVISFQSLKRKVKKDGAGFVPVGE